MSLYNLQVTLCSWCMCERFQLKLHHPPYCTPKFPLSFLKKSLIRSSLIQDYTRFDQLKHLLKHWQLKIRVWVCTKIIDLLMPYMNFMDHFGSPILLMSSFKLWITFLLSQLISWPKINYIWEKSTVVNLQSNFIIFNPHQHH